MAMNGELFGVPSDSVRDVETPDGAVLLDIRQGLCLSMNIVGARIWNLLKLQRSWDEINARISEEFTAPLEDVQTDARAFIHALLMQKVIVEPKDKSNNYSKLNKACTVVIAINNHLSRRSIKKSLSGSLLLLQSLTALVLFDLLGLSSDFARMHEFVSAWRTNTQELDPRAAVQIVNAVNRAFLWYPKRVRCLQRSAVLTCLLRLYGIKAAMVLGAQKFPFRAHAWTEVDGQVLNERRDVRSFYLVWERC
jgi:hypothetical protein